MRRLFARWRDHDGGLAAIEFAFVLPIMLSMLIGLVELSNALGARAAVSNVASSAADLVAQESAASGSDMDTVFGALTAMLNGYSPTGTTITISSIIDGGTGNPPKVAWSCRWQQGSTSPAAPLTKGSTALTPTLPTGLITGGDGTSVIWAEINYNYDSLLKYFLPSTLNWTNDFYVKPRRALQIPFSGTPTTANARCNS